MMQFKMLLIQLHYNLHNLLHKAVQFLILTYDTITYTAYNMIP